MSTLTTATPAQTPVTYKTFQGETRTGIYTGEHHTSTLPGQEPTTRYALQVGPTTVWVDRAKVDRVQDRHMTLEDFRQLGITAYNNDGPRAAVQHAEVRDALWGRSPGDPTTLAILEAFNRGWNQAADEAAWAAIQD